MNEKEIQNAVQDKVSKGDSFTALDVTNTLTGIPHADVNAEVRRMFDAGELVGYTRTSRYVGNAGNKAYVYHPTTEDASQYGQNPTLLVTAAQAVSVLQS